MDLQEVFSRVRESRKEKKTLQAVYRDALVASKAYQDVVEELKQLQQKKKQIESSIKADLRSELEKIERMKLNMNADQQLLNDIALNQFMKGQTVEVRDEYDSRYEPVFQVKFKKAS